MTASGVKPTLVYLYGPPASGKLTVATGLAELTGFSLFHNHLSVDAVRRVLPFGSKPYIEVLHRLRLDVFQTAARARISVIFTNSSAWSGARAGQESRRRLGKLTDIARLREQVAGLDQSKLHPDDLEIDTSTASAAEAALYIQDALAAR